MKKILYCLLLTVTVFVFSSPASAENTTGNSTHRFVIDGHVAFDIPDSCYNIYITDVDKEITESDFVVRVPVKDKRFRFETDLNTMKAGRIRAIMPGDHLCSAWINIYFIPGFTVNMTVHNGYYDIHNKSDYNFMVNAWLNKDAMGALIDNFCHSSNSTTPSAEDNVTIALRNYSNMLNQLRGQVDYLKTLPYGTYNEMREIMKRMENINAKMEKIIDQYTSTLKF